MKPATNLMKIFAYVEERRKIRSTKDISKTLDAVMQPKRVVRLEVKTEEDKSTSRRVGTILSSNLLYSIVNPDWHITTNSLLWNRLSTTDKVLIKFVFQALLYGIWREKNGRSLGTPSSNLLSLSHILTRWFSVCNLC
ncbi:hypothetical protein F2Q69_00020798 [Brassica cretica]|uniref:Uncharacterized protein n=1 Tax=Brassica cretica TaxID=69181 RepID=A0A8S9QJA2_BRACR|nr:hypothetical protein F2Q69_00020798 [Brassica cretica]